MNVQFAKGELAPIESKLCSGLLDSLRSRIAERPQTTYYRWTLYKHIRRPRLMSYKAVVIPGPTGQSKRERNGIVQAVVRVHSLQSLRRGRVKGVRDRRTGKVDQVFVELDDKGKELPEYADTFAIARYGAKQVVEYIVIQKVMRNSEEGPWKVWGTTTEARLDELKMGMD
jgi:mitochondrial protein MBA1